MRHYHRPVSEGFNAFGKVALTLQTYYETIVARPVALAVAVRGRY